MKKLFAYLYPFLKPHLKQIIGAMILSICLVAIKSAQAIIVKPIFDHGLNPDSTFEQAAKLAAILLALGLANFPARFLHFYWLRYVVDKATCALRDSAYLKLQRLPLGFFQKEKQGALISNMITDTHMLSSGFRGGIDVVRELLTAVAMFGVALSRDWQLTLVIVVVAPLFAVIFSKSGKYVKVNQAQVQEEMADMTHNIGEGIGGQKIIKAFNLQEYILGRFQKSQDNYFHSLMRTTKVEEMAHPLVEFVGAIAFSGVILFAHQRISSGAMSTGDFVSFVAALALLMDPIRKYSQANVKINQARAAGDRIFRLLETPEEKNEGAVELNEFKERIEIKNVTFSYGEGEVLKDFSLTIPKGQRTALVGMSGSGKSTLINLLLKLYPIEKGEITIDGHPIQNITLGSLRNLFGLVSQDIFLFHDTIKENLEVGKNFQVKKIEEAISVAGAHEFIAKLPQNVDTVIGDRGTRLSGGQAQRVTIGRAFLQDSPVLLFDEATSALDNESEKVVQAALDRLSGHKTVVAVAHRLSTIQEFENIVVMKEGKKIEEGKHVDLMAKNGEYSKLYELSMKA